MLRMMVFPSLANIISPLSIFLIFTSSS